MQNQNIRNHIQQVFHGDGRATWVWIVSQCDMPIIDLEMASHSRSQLAQLVFLERRLNNGQHHLLIRQRDAQPQQLLPGGSAEERARLLP